MFIARFFFSTTKNNKWNRRSAPIHQHTNVIRHCQSDMKTPHYVLWQPQLSQLESHTYLATFESERSIHFARSTLTRSSSLRLWTVRFVYGNRSATNIVQMIIFQLNLIILQFLDIPFIRFNNGCSKETGKYEYFSTKISVHIICHSPRCFYGAMRFVWLCIDFDRNSCQCVRFLFHFIFGDLQKKALESTNARLALVMKSGKFCLGYKQTLKTLRQGKAKLIIIANNTPPLR